MDNNGNRKYVLFLGCTIPARARNYEMSARKVAERIGLNLVDDGGFTCCGFPLKAMDHKTSLMVSANNLSIAEEHGLNIMTLCSSCTSALTEDARALNSDKTLREEINRSLKKTDHHYGGSVQVKHFARILSEDFAADEIKNTFSHDLSILRVAIHYGCHYLKPAEIYDGFDKVGNPSTLDRLVELTGAESVDFAFKYKCCGGPVVASDEETALKVTKNKLDAIHDVKADLICLVCPFCAVMFDSNQKGIGERFGMDYKIPVLYLPQLLGLAMGMSGKELGLNLNVVKTKELMAKLESTK